MRRANLAYVDQSRDTLRGEKSVWEEISDGQENVTLGTREVNSRAYVARFNSMVPISRRRWELFLAENATECISQRC